MEKNFIREMGSLEGVFEFIDGFLSAQGASGKVAFSLRLAVEELFTNLIKHNIKRHAIGHNEISISIEKQSGRFILRLKDFDVESFPVPTSKEVDTTLPLNERKVGGLGVHLVRHVVDNLTYDFKDGNLSVTVIKNMETEDV